MTSIEANQYAHDWDQVDVQGSADFFVLGVGKGRWDHLVLLVIVVHRNFIYVSIVKMSFVTMINWCAWDGWQEL